jgi:hypothetical protein
MGFRQSYIFVMYPLDEVYYPVIQTSISEDILTLEKYCTIQAVCNIQNDIYLQVQADWYMIGLLKLFIFRDSKIVTLLSN